MAEYRVLHLAAHGIMSTKVPARSALVLRPSETEDGLLQAREILNLRLNASLVTLSACDTSTGAAQGQDGVASLVRPFVAAGARAVVANLWAADDTFSAAMMREFYRELASGGDIGESLRRAKLRMIETFGPEAVPRLWSGVLVHGDAAAVVIPSWEHRAERGLEVTFLTEPQRRTVFDKVLRLVDTKFMGADVDVNQLRDAHESRVVNANTPEDFEQALDGLLRDLKTSHTGLFHEARPRSAGRIAMAATLTKADTATDGHRWVFQDVHPGGVAAAVGIESGDVLLAVDDQELVPPAAIPFRLGESYTIAVRKPDGSTTRSTLAIPGSREKKRPIVVPDQVVSARKLDPDVGYIRVSMFPGVLGMDVARDISRAVSELDCERLVIDLRGNTGGGIGCLRLMSHLCADRRGVGYSVGRKLARNGYDKNRLAAVRSHSRVEAPSPAADRQVRIGRTLGRGVHRSSWRSAPSRPGCDARERALGQRRGDGRRFRVRVSAGDARRHDDGRPTGGDERIQSGVRLSGRDARRHVLHVARHKSRGTRTPADNRRTVLVRGQRSRQGQSTGAGGADCSRNSDYRPCGLVDVAISAPARGTSAIRRPHVAT